MCCVARNGSRKNDFSSEIFYVVDQLEIEDLLLAVLFNELCSLKMVSAKESDSMELLGFKIISIKYRNPLAS